MKLREFKRWELALLALGGGLLLGPGLLGVMGFSLLEWSEGRAGSGEGAPVGQIEQLSGSVRLQPARETVFRPAEAREPVRNLDTLVTDSDSAATVALDDGTRLEIAASSMIRIAFESQGSLFGVARVPRVEVLSGRVKGQSGTSVKPVRIVTRKDVIVLPVAAPAVIEALPEPPRAAPEAEPASVELAQAPQVSPLDEPERAPEPELSPTSPAQREVPPTLAQSTPSPSPEPIPVAEVSPSPSPSPAPVFGRRIRILSPRAGAKLEARLNEQGTPTASVRFELEVTPPRAILELKLTQLGRPGGTTPIELREVTEGERPIRVFEASLTQPGAYRLQALSGAVESKLPFEVSRRIGGLQGLPPLFGGKAASSNYYQGESLKKFEITLRWKGPQSVRTYLLRYQVPGVPQREVEVTGESFSLPKAQAGGGQIRFSVRAPLEGGFELDSGPQRFEFNFNAPEPVSPKDGETLSILVSADGEEGLLLTWRKTNFTRSYEIEIASDPGFTQRVGPLYAQPENFLSVQKLPPGRYWWRVRSLTATETASPFSKPRSFIVR